MGKKIKVNNKKKAVKKKKQPLIVQVNPFHKQLTIRVPASLLTLFLQMDELIDTEWMVLGKVKEYKDGEVILSDEYYIPEQEATGGSVNPKEFPEGFDVAIHRHPSGLHSFSGTDWEYINQSFPVSLLWVDRQLAQAVMQVSTPAGFTWIPLKIELMVSEDIKKTVKEKVNKPKYMVTKSSKSTGYKQYQVNNMNTYFDEEDTARDTYLNRGAMTIAELVAKDPDMSVYEIQNELEARGIYLTTEEIERMLFGF